eukprot:TRINITY_DN10703_c0_g3_i1.p1 TRINITY_DN10703_c0_g3~~TRINITY_DN10703_c0_g3_i1.p1  ORF type:complete len:652 (+),score=84.98 TRINITY_DN10703_c0_g3_i1:36-1991(+)
MAADRSAHAEHASILLYVLVGVYLLLLVCIARVAHARKARAASSQGEVRAHFGGSFNAPLLILTTFSTVYSGFTVTGIPEEAKVRGFISLRWIGCTLVIVAGMLLLYPRLRRLAVERSYTSPNDFISDRFGSNRLRILCAVCGVVPMLIYITAQMISFAAMLEGMTFGVMPKWASLLAFCVITLGLEKLGGMNSVVLTDAVQSAVMIAAFLAIPFALGARFGFLPSIAAETCEHLEFVMPNASHTNEYPATCGAAEMSGCVPAGCVGAVKPEFYTYPAREAASDVTFFLLNMVAAPLQPHMVQRAYIAATDRDLRYVMAAMLFAPFIAQTPGIVMGLTSAAYEPSWPAVAQDATAFSAITGELMQAGWLQYLLSALMTCSTLAAIMSTADSALMGASSIVAVDIYQGVLVPSASNKAMVLAGELNSLVLCGAAYALGLVLTVDQLGSILVFQNGLLMQLLPAFGLGLFTNVREWPVTFGIVAGLISLIVCVAFGSPCAEYVPVINVAVFCNFLSVAILQALTRGTESLAPGVSQGTTTASHKEDTVGKQLTLADIQAYMSGTREPRLALLLSMLALALLSAPWYGTPGNDEPSYLGVPRWGLVQCSAYVAIFCLGACATCQWRPVSAASAGCLPDGDDASAVVASSSTASI